MTAFGLFPAANPRIRWLRSVLIGAMLSGMLCCLPLWLSTRAYPLVPFFPPWLILPPSSGPWLLGLTLVSLLAAAWFFRPAISFFLVATLYLFGCDQNREQPWFYIYWVMLLLNFLPEPTALAACRLAFAFVYLWAGIQKINGTFFSEVPAWFVQPAADWGWPNAVVAAMREGVLLTPALEIFIATGIWFKKTRWFAIATAVILHVAALLFLGPIGRDVNHVIWPWNIDMIALLVVLFATKECVSLPEVWQDLRRCRSGILLVGLYGLLPLLSFFGWWDSYLSFALYSYNLADADVYVSPSLLDHLPSKLQTYVYPVKHFNPALQLPYMLEYRIWAEAEMGAPPLPEPRGYLILFHHVEAYATNDDDCRLLVKTRSGRILLYHLNDQNPTVLK
jgi:uncharacterized membrane protein YphA (DoxX/SURF4 family)